MSSFLTLGLYFVFHRFWSIRNLDIILLILLAPGLLMVHEGRRRQLLVREAEAVAARESEATRQQLPAERARTESETNSGTEPAGTDPQLEAAAALLIARPTSLLVQTDGTGPDGRHGRSQHRK